MSRGPAPRAVRLGSTLGLAPRAIRDHPGRSALTAVAIALGVGLVLATLALSATIDDSLRKLYGTAYGNTDLVVSSANGGARVPAATAERARSVPGVEVVTGLVTSPVSLFDGQGRLLDGPQDALQLTGLEPTGVDPAGARYVTGRAARGADELTLQRDFARARGLALGDRVRIAVPAGVVELRLVGTYTFSAGAAVSGQGFGLLPLATARRAFDAPKDFDVLAVKAADEDVDGLQQRLRERLGPGVDVLTISQQAGQVLDQLQALKLLLIVFGAMSVFTAGVLINGVFSLTMAQRRREIGVLRAMGLRRAAVRRVVLAEAGVLALAGTAAGVLLGTLGAQAMLAMARALRVPTADLVVPWWALAIGIAAGLVATLVSVLMPATRAAALPPVHALARSPEALPEAEGARRRTALGAGLLALGVVVVLSPIGGDGATGTVAAGALSAALLLSGAALLAPAACRPLLDRVARAVATRSAAGRVGADAVRTNLARSTAAACTLMVGLGLVAALGTLGESFLRSVADDLDRGFRQDVTIQPPGLNPLSGAPVQGIAPAVTRLIAGTPGVQVAAKQRLLSVPDALGDASGILLGVDPATFPAVDGRRYDDGVTSAQVMAALRRGEVALADGIAARRGLQRGDPVVFDGPRGALRTRVAAIFPDPAYLGRTVLVSTRTLGRTYGVRRDSNVLVVAEPGTDERALVLRLEGVLRTRAPQLEVLETKELRRQVDLQVAQQFGVMNVLLSVTILLTLLGLAATLTMSVLERSREIATLRALGLTRRRLRRAVLYEALIIAVVGVGLGLLAGLALGALFTAQVHDLLPTIGLVVPFGTIAAVSGLAVGLAALASVLPARRAARARLLDGLGYD